MKGCLKTELVSVRILYCKHRQKNRRCFILHGSTRLMSWDCGRFVGNQPMLWEVLVKTACIGGQGLVFTLDSRGNKSAPTLQAENGSTRGKRGIEIRAGTGATHLSIGESSPPTKTFLAKDVSLARIIGDAGQDSRARLSLLGKCLTTEYASSYDSPHGAGMLLSIDYFKKFMQSNGLIYYFSCIF